MGTYNYSKGMLIEEISNFLDDIEGDFNSKDLINALEILKSYALTTDSTQLKLKLWRKLKKKFEGEE